MRLQLNIFEIRRMCRMIVKMNKFIILQVFFIITSLLILETCITNSKIIRPRDIKGIISGCVIDSSILGCYPQS